MDHTDPPEHEQHVAAIASCAARLVALRRRRRAWMGTLAAEAAAVRSSLARVAGPVPDTWDGLLTPPADDTDDDDQRVLEFLAGWGFMRDGAAWVPKTAARPAAPAVTPHGGKPSPRVGERVADSDGPRGEDTAPCRPLLSDAHRGLVVWLADLPSVVTPPLSEAQLLVAAPQLALWLNDAALCVAFDAAVGPALLHAGLLPATAAAPQVFSQRFLHRGTRYAFDHGLLPTPAALLAHSAALLHGGCGLYPALLAGSMPPEAARCVRDAVGLACFVVGLGPPPAAHTACTRRLRGVGGGVAALLRGADRAAATNAAHVAEAGPGVLGALTALLAASDAIR